MKKWKKYALSGVCATMALTACFAFAACGRDGGVTNRFVVEDGNTISVKGKEGESIAFPDVSKEGFIFKGWYNNPDYTGMPVTSATFDGETTYYARWAQGYEIKFDLGGGSLSGYDASQKIYLEAGASISDFVKDYIPVNGEYRFGGWFVDGTPVGANDRMPASSVELLARYMAEYSVNVHVRNLEDTGYTVNDALKVTDYALIGEAYTPAVTLTGLTQTTHDDQVVTKTISTNKSENVFEYYFDRNEVTLTLNSNYPDASPELDIHDYLYGQTVALPQNPFSKDGLRFLGWGTSPNATYADVLKGDDYMLGGNDVLYAVWNVAYTDALTGEDHIYHVYNTDADGNLSLDTGKITLSRGGVDIESSNYNPDTGIYTVSGKNVDISVQLNDDGTFVYYANRQGTYVLVENGTSINRAYTVVLDNANGITYASTEEGKEFTKTGTYTIDADGMYTATVSAEGGEEETLVFKIGIAQSSSGYVTIFQVRGEEINYGVYDEEMGKNILFRISNGSTYYPIITLDGFGEGSAYLPTNSGEDLELALTYTLVDGVLTFTIPEYSQQPFVTKFVDYNGYTLYSLYEAALDGTFTNTTNGATLVLDGIETATYTNGSTSLTGTYTADPSVLFDNIVRIVSGDKTYSYLIRGTNFIENENGYTDYRFINETTGSISVPILEIDGNEGAFYEINGQSLGVVSTGTISFDGIKYVYTATSEIASWATAKYTKLTFMTESVALTDGTSANVFYILSYETAEGAQQVAAVYTNGNAKLTVTAAFATYEDGNGLVVTDMYQAVSGTNSIIVAGNEEDYYFDLNADDNTFVKLEQRPIVAQRYLSDTELSTTDLLTLTGKVTDGIQQAVYTDGTSAWTGTFDMTPSEVSGGGMAGSFFTFTGTNAAGEAKTMYFTYSSAIAQTSDGQRVVVYFFVEYTQDNPLASIGAMGADGNVENQQGSISLLTDGKIVYNNGTTSVAGTIAADDDYWAFDEELFTVYTFTPENGAAFRYSLRQRNNAYYFVLAEEGENLSYTAADGSQLLLDSVAHIAKYTDADGREYTEFYFVTENALNAQPAYSIYFDGATHVFDVTENGKSFTTRGSEAATYLVIDNGDLNGMRLNLNGYGAALYAEMNAEQGENGTYTIANGDVTVTVGNVTFTGKTDVLQLNDAYYNVFYIEKVGFAGNYLNEEDLSVLVLDAYGNATKFTSYGDRVDGAYTALDDGLFFFVNADGTDGGVYMIGANNTVVLENYGKTYYAYDLSAIVFDDIGLVSVDGATMFYHYDAQTNSVTTYRRATESDATANDYGFVSEKHTLGADNTLTLNGKEYKLGDGTVEFTLTGSDGSKVVFYPTGEEEFDIEGSYTANGATQATPCVVSVMFVGETLSVVVSINSEEDLNGSIYDYTFSNEYELTFDAATKQYTFGEVTKGIVSIDYNYELGYLYIFKTEDGYSVSGNFAGLGMTFTNGILSRAGYVNQNYGHLYTCEFTGTLNLGDQTLQGTFHLSFYLVPGESGMYEFITYLLTYVDNETEDYLPVNGSTDTVCTFDSLIYSLFNVNQNAAYPVLKVNGEVICSVDYGFVSDDTLRFVADTYNVDDSNQYCYDVKFTVGDDNETIVSADSVTKYSYLVLVSEDETEAVRILCDSAGALLEVEILIVNGARETIDDCTKNGDNSFTVTTKTGVYTVTVNVEDETFTVTKTSEFVLVSSLSDIVLAVRDCTTKEFTAIAVIATAQGEETVTECVKNDDGSFTATTEHGTYTVTITVTGEGETEQLSVTVVEVSSENA